MQTSESLDRILAILDAEVCSGSVHAVSMEHVQHLTYLLREARMVIHSVRKDGYLPPSKARLGRSILDRPNSFSGEWRALAEDYLHLLELLQKEGAPHDVKARIIRHVIDCLKKAKVTLPYA